MYVQRAGFLDGMPGLILSGLYAYYTVMKYAKFWELYEGVKCLASLLVYPVHWVVPDRLRRPAF